MPVLPRVSAALEQLVSPVSGRNLTVRPSPKSHDFRRESFPHLDRKKEPSHQEGRQQQSPQQEKLPTNVIELKAKDGPPPVLESPTSPATPPGNQETRAGIAQTWVQIIDLFQEPKKLLIRWLGAKTYSSGNGAQRKAGRIKTGSIFDQKAG